MTTKGYIYSDQVALIGKREIVGFGSNDFYVKEIKKSVSNEIIIANHYSKKVAGAATTYIYLGVFFNGELLGTLQYGFLMNPASAKNIVANTSPHECLELNRMWLSDKAPRNSESMAISYSIKYIRQKFPKVGWIQSFADERCGGFGIVYQSANFLYFGEHLTDFYTLDGEFIHKIIVTSVNDNSAICQKVRARKDELEKHTLRQFRYIYFIYPNIKKKCLLKEQPYPKHYKENQSTADANTNR